MDKMTAERISNDDMVGNRLLSLATDLAHIAGRLTPVRPKLSQLTGQNRGGSAQLIVNGSLCSIGLRSQTRVLPLGLGVVHDKNTTNSWSPID